MTAVADGPAVTGRPAAAAGTGEAAPGPRGIEVTSFVGSVLEDDGSVTVLLRGRCDAGTARLVGEHLETAIARGTRFLTVEIIGPFEAGRDVYELLGRTQTRLAARRGLLVVRGLRSRGPGARSGATDTGSSTRAPTGAGSPWSST